MESGQENNGVQCGEGGPGVIHETWRDVPLILLSGMGADERAFLPQLNAFPNAIVPKWIEPRCAKRWRVMPRMADRVNPRRWCFIGARRLAGCWLLFFHLDTQHSVTQDLCQHDKHLGVLFG